MALQIRVATPEDRTALALGNSQMAWETEHKRLDPATVAAGVVAVFTDPTKGFYLVGEIDGTVVGQLMVTTEWSDWRNGWFWWIQSVYVREDARRQGIFRALFDETIRRGKDAGNVVGVRLYVERDNRKAQQTYESLGMAEGPYWLFERSPL